MKRPSDAIRRRRTRAWPIVTSFVALLAVALVLAGGYLLKTTPTAVTSLLPGDHTVATLPYGIPESSQPPPDSGNAAKAVNILLIGSDSRGATENTAQVGDASNQRSDVMILVHISADRKSVSVMSMMRDLWVSIPGRGKHKLNAALAYGGVPLAVRTCEHLIGVHIDHVMMMNFDGFAAMTNALHGVTINVPIPFTSKNVPGFTFRKGSQNLDGDAALAFVRERYSFATGDYQRVRDQQIFLKAILRRLRTTGTLTNFVKLVKFASTVTPYVAVDKNFSTARAATLAYSLRQVRVSNVHFFTLPTNGTGSTVNGQSIVRIDRVAVRSIGQALRHDTMRTYFSRHPDL